MKQISYSGSECSVVQGHNPVFAVIPAYNEELTISMVVHLTARYVDHVIVVDDGSADRTAEIAGYAGAEVIRVDPNRGKANAMKIGIQRAKELGCGIVVFLDADGQHDPAEIPMVISPVLHDDADLVIGSRYLVDSDETPRYRRVGQKALDYATNLGKNIKITDTQSGFRAMQCSKIDSMSFRSEGYNVETDMIHYYEQDKRKKIPFSQSRDSSLFKQTFIGFCVSIFFYLRIKFYCSALDDLNIRAMKGYIS